VTSDALYHEALVRLARASEKPRRLERTDGSATRDNPLCGDEVTIDVRVAGGRIEAIGQRVRGCALCQAATTILAEAAPGLGRAELDRAREALRALLEGGGAPDGRFAELAVFTPVHTVPSRHGCVLLPFDALADALARAGA
jgi:nitrogen fixation NifU-like protein